MSARRRRVLALSFLLVGAAIADSRPSDGGFCPSEQVRGLGMATTDPSKRQVHHRPRDVTDETQSLDRRESAPRIDLTLFNVGSGVSGENRHPRHGRGLDHGAIVERATFLNRHVRQRR